MQPKLVHKHLLIRALVDQAPDKEFDLDSALKDLVSRINMKILAGPFTAFCPNEGNVGFSGTVIIETSHIAIHCWNEPKPNVIQLDVYTCSDMAIKDVTDWLDENFGVLMVDMKFLDRENGFEYIL
jgi:S-adenosylmethionine/arginine decarboxylase-like enzyme